MHILRKALILSVALSLLLGVDVSLAQDVKEDSINEWRIENHLFSFKPPEGKTCQDVWDELWKKAKDGDLESMSKLANLAFPGFPGLPQMVFPGRSGDELSAIRDSIILDIHGRHMRSDEESSGDLDSLTKVFLSVLPFGDGYIQCKETRTADHCARAAVENVFLIPSFEEYAEEVDLFLTNGMKPRCTTYMKRKMERDDLRKPSFPQ